MVKTKKILTTLLLGLLSVLFVISSTLTISNVKKTNAAETEDVFITREIVAGDVIAGKTVAFWYTGNSQGQFDWIKLSNGYRICYLSGSNLTLQTLDESGNPAGTNTSCGSVSVPETAGWIEWTVPSVIGLDFSVDISEATVVETSGSGKKPVITELKSNYVKKVVSKGDVLAGKTVFFYYPDTTSTTQIALSDGRILLYMSGTNLHYKPSDGAPLGQVYTWAETPSDGTWNSCVIPKTVTFDGVTVDFTKVTVESASIYIGNDYDTESEYLPYYYDLVEEPVDVVEEKSSRNIFATLLSLSFLSSVAVVVFVLIKKKRRRRR